jgi:hypothetical protein
MGRTLSIVLSFRERERERVRESEREKGEVVVVRDTTLVGGGMETLLSV